MQMTYTNPSKKQLKEIEKRLENIEKVRRREISLFGLVFIIVLTLVTNLWAQYVYNSFVRNHGMGARDDPSLVRMVIYTLIGVTVVYLFVNSSPARTNND